MVALVFHAGLALDRSHQFLDFSAVLFALFPLFLTPSFGTWVGERVGSVRARLALRSERLPLRVHLLLVSIPTSIGVLVALYVVGPAPPLPRSADTRGGEGCGSTCRSRW